MASTTLTIDTILGQQQPTGDRGPLLLAAAQGVEGISTPYAYDVTMYHSLDAPDIDPQQLINTPVTIGMRGPSSVLYQELDYYTYRRGIFQTFEKDETTEHPREQGFQKNFRVYKGRIVPAFKMLDFEIRYRVFEELTVLEIMQEIIDGFPQISSYSTYVDDNKIDKSKLPPMLYCVQFGESSFNFLSRLMGLFDIWYYFDHQPDNRGNNQKEKMVLGKDPTTFAQSKLHDMNIVYSAPELVEISGFQRSFAPAHKKIWVSNFNPVNPTDVPRGNSSPKDPYEIWPTTGPDRIQRDVFPAPFDNPKNNQEAMEELAESKVEDEENNVFTVQGQCKNPTLVAGRTFHVAQDKTSAHSDAVGTPTSNNYMITTLSFAAYENAYGHYWGHDVANFLLSPFRWIWGQFRKKNLTQGLFLDSTAALASGGLANWVQGQNILNSTRQPYTPPRLASKLPVPPNFGDSVVAGLDATMVGSLVQMAISSNLKETLQNHGDDYSNAFIALPWNPEKDPKYDQLPNPDGVKPRVLGPHLAVVIGQDGTDTKKGDIWADTLGRVRVRFPWQRDVPPSSFGLIDPWEPSSNSTKPFETDRRTCWVRVAEEWAGRYYGTQFLPRIGQEVIVSFIDGDPDRPIITGRVYNADYGTTNLPFPNKDTASTKIDNVTALPGTARHDLPRSGIKTYSVPTKDSQGKPLTPGYHLLRFDDTRGKEQYLIRSQGRLDMTVFNHRYETIHRDRNLTVGGKSYKDGQPYKIGGDYITKIYRHYYLHVGDPDFPTQSGNRITRLEQNDELYVDKDSKLVSGTWSGATGDYYLHVGGGPQSGGKKSEIVDHNSDLLIKGDYNMMISGEWKTALASQMSVRSDTTIVLEAFSNITLVVGGSSIVITPAGIQITGPIIQKNSGASPASPNGPETPPQNDPSISNPQDPTPADPGDSLTPPKWQE
jgi:uncharacterized protein involved in type VI secretion and phage assembly